MKEFKKLLVEEFGATKPTPGQVLRAYRKRDRFTLKMMEEITGVAESNLSALEGGAIPMTKHYAELFAAALKAHPTAFLYPSGEFALDEELKLVEKRGDLMRKKA